MTTNLDLNLKIIAALAGAALAAGCSGSMTGAAGAPDATNPPTGDGGAPDGAGSDPGSGSNPGSGSGSGSGGFTPIQNISTGAQVVKPGDNIAAIVSACAQKIVHFSAGTYNITQSIDVPSGCTLEGELDWKSIITGGPADGGEIFQLNLSSDVTITRLNFQNIAGLTIGNQYGNGIHTGTIKNPHIYLNLFEHIGVKGNGNYGSPAIWLWDPENAVIERNAFNDILGDCIHLYSTNNGAFTEAFTSASDTIRWNFDANQNNRSGGGNDNGFSMMEVQAANGNSTIFQNVFYSQVAYTACAFSIAAGGAPCTTNSGGFSGCVPPSLNGGKSGIVIDGNIMLNNGINGPTPAGGVFGGVETMGVTPLVQNNWQRGWGSLSFTAYMFAYDPGTKQYSEGAQEPVYFQNNTACDVGDGSPESNLLVSEQDGHTPMNLSQDSSNKYQTTCAGMAPPPLPPQVVVPPDLLDGSGGLNALVPNNFIPGPNTYWAHANANLDSNFQ